MNCLWKLRQLRRVTVWELIRQGCQRFMDCQHHPCIPWAVPVIPTQLLQKIRSPESLLTRGSFSHQSMVMLTPMEVDACTCQVSIQHWICKAFDYAYWSKVFFFLTTSWHCYSFHYPVQLRRWLEFEGWLIEGESAYSLLPRFCASQINGIFFFFKVFFWFRSI